MHSRTVRFSRRLAIFAKSLGDCMYTSRKMARSSSDQGRERCRQAGGREGGREVGQDSGVLCRSLLSHPPSSRALSPFCHPVCIACRTFSSAMSSSGS